MTPLLQKIETSFERQNAKS